MKNLAPVLQGLGLMTMLFSATMLVPVATALWYDDGTFHAYDEALLVTLATGAALWFATRGSAQELQPRDGFLLVTLVWSVLPAFAALPLLIHIDGLSFTDAYFETISGLTTTGASVLSGLDELPPSINMWRCLLQWLGGMGIIVLAVAILPLLGVGGSQIFKAETPGPMKDTKLTPRITETAKGLWLVYSGISAACVVSFRLAGMSWYDAVLHAFTTMSLGGFSNHDASYGFFDSPLIEAVTIFFMLVSGINFATHFTALRARSLGPYRRDPEAPWFLIAMVGSVLVITAYLWLTGTYSDALTALRFAAFNVVSAGTTTGYANTDYGLWPVFAPFTMLLLCVITSSSGSTGGGIKMIRTRLLAQQGMREMLKLLHPQAPAPIKLGAQVVPNQIVFAVLAFMSLYGASVTVMTMVLLASGLDFITAFTAVIACITNTGPGLAQVGPATNYASLTDFQTWVLALAMLLGRLELFTVLVLFTPAFWRK
ncbi:MAG: TrkH family potassium uptake protein [Betaproteobacteria bacterium]|nr:TrkH family potassium uptake protein [Betaproteobacteria bacterium]